MLLDTVKLGWLYVINPFDLNKDWTVDDVDKSHRFILINPAHIISVEQVYVFWGEDTDKAENAVYIVHMLDNRHYWTIGDVYSVFSDIPVELPDSPVSKDALGWAAV